MKYKEEQKFRRSDILLILVALIGGTFYRFVDILFFENKFNSGEVLVALGILSALGGILYFLLSFRLTTKVTKKGIRYKLFPFHHHLHKIPWEEIDQWRVVEVPLRAKLSGWTIHYGTPELMYSFNGRTGLELDLKDGRKLFLGSRHPDELAEAIQQLTPKGQH